MFVRRQSKQSIRRKDQSMTIKVSVICSSGTTISAIKGSDPAPTGVVVTMQTGSPQTVAGVLRREMPDVVLLDLPVADEQAMQQIEVALRKAPGTHMALVSLDRSVEFLMRAMRAGVREVLPAPMNSSTLQQVIKHAQAKQLVNDNHGNSDGQVIALVPAKGGAGATFLATNLAFALSRQERRVAVLDLDLFLGDASIFLGDKPVVSSIVDLAGQTDRLDSALLHSSMIKISDHLHLLAASESPEDANEVSAAGAEKIIELARSQYDFVLLDVSNTLDPVSIKALDLADTICLTLQLNLPFIRAAKHMASVFRQLGYSREKVSVVVNRYETVDTITLADVEKATLLKISRTIPNSHATVSASVNQGIPVLEMAPRDPVARALQAWAKELAPPAAETSRRWWHGLMNSSS
jgi:pilus assembly protein CpaE